MNGPASEAARREARLWLDFAIEDRIVLDLALDRARSLVVSAASHTQQAAEKLLKALLILADRPFPKTHDMALLLSLLGPVDGFAEGERLFIGDLTPWGVRMRSPSAGDAMLPGTADTREALRCINHLATLVRAAIDAP